MSALPKEIFMYLKKQIWVGKLRPKEFQLELSQEH